MIAAWPGTTPPDGWLACDGSAVSRTTYADLFAVLGTSRGAGNGTTTFNLPNYKGRNLVGYDDGQTEFNAIGKQGGAKTHTLSVNEMPHHGHSVHDPGHAHSTRDRWFMDAGGAGNLHMQGGGNGYARGLQTVGVNASGTGIWLGGTGGGAAHNNLAPYGVELIIIKF